jgi:MarR family multiple antibiotic resistance transcriptional regulator
MSKVTLKSTIDRFWEVVPSTWVNVRSRLRANAVQEHNLTLIQFHMLRHIRNGINTVAELASIQHVSRPAVSQAVEQLVQKQLVLRTPDPLDRRYVLLSLTTKGQNLLDAVFNKTKSWMQNQMVSLTSQELEILNQAFDILKHTIQNTRD